MTEETPAPEGEAIVEHETLDDTVETTSEATPEQDTGTEEAGLADDTGEEAEEQPTKRVPWFQKRIDEVTRAKYEAQREADYWRGRAEGRDSPQEKQAQVGPPDRWEDPEGHDRWLIEQAALQFEQRHRQQTVFQTFEERAAKVRATKPDFDSVVTNPDIMITNDMAAVIRESDLGPEVAYHLGTNPAEAQRIAALPPHRQAAELGRIEAALSAPPAVSSKPIPPAPPPTVGGISSGLSKPLEEMSMAEYIAARKAEQT